MQNLRSLADKVGRGPCKCPKCMVERARDVRDVVAAHESAFLRVRTRTIKRSAADTADAAAVELNEILRMTDTTVQNEGEERPSITEQTMPYAAEGFRTTAPHLQAMAMKAKRSHVADVELRIQELETRQSLAFLLEDWLRIERIWRRKAA